MTLFTFIDARFFDRRLSGRSGTEGCHSLGRVSCVYKNGDCRQSQFVISLTLSKKYDIVSQNTLFTTRLKIFRLEPLYKYSSILLHLYLCGENKLLFTTLYILSEKRHAYEILYTGLFSHREIFVLLHLQTLSPRLELVQTKLCLKRDSLIHWNSSSFKFVRWQRGRKGRK